VRTEPRERQIIMNKDMRFAVVLTKQGLEELKENLGNFLIDQPLLRCSKVDLDQPYLSMKAFNDKTKQFCRLHIPHHFVQFVAEQVAGKTLVGFDSRSAKKAKRPVVKIPEAGTANKP
jgi:hypothetical protein